MSNYTPNLESLKKALQAKAAEQGVTYSDLVDELCIGVLNYILEDYSPTGEVGLELLMTPKPKSPLTWLWHQYEMVDYCEGCAPGQELTSICTYIGLDL